MMENETHELIPITPKSNVIKANNSKFSVYCIRFIMLDTFIAYQTQIYEENAFSLKNNENEKEVHAN